jgi:hypothetical protein
VKEPYVPEIRRPEAVNTALENLRQARAQREQVAATHFEARELERRARMNATGVVPGRTKAEGEEAAQAAADAKLDLDRLDAALENATADERRARVELAEVLVTQYGPWTQALRREWSECDEISATNLAALVESERWRGEVHAASRWLEDYVSTGFGGRLRRRGGGRATPLVKNGFTGERYREDEVFTGLQQWLAETSVEHLEADGPEVAARSERTG